VYPRSFSILPAILAAVALLLAGGCANQSLIQGPKGASDAETAKFEPIRDIPIPTGSTLDNDKSLILANDKEWTGRVVLKADPSMPKLFAYYGQQMRNLGWQPVASVMGETGVLTFVQGARAATVQIKPAMFGGSIVTVTMAPRHDASGFGTQAVVPDQSIQAERLPPYGASSRH